MACGKVKWFNNAKGYGFVRPETGGDDLFVHYSYVIMDGYKSLKAGQTISYDTREAPKGIHAVNITMLDAEVDDAGDEASYDEQESVPGIENEAPSFEAGGSEPSFEV